MIVDQPPCGVVVHGQQNGVAVGINRLMLVVSGLAGPATHAAAMMVKEIASELPFAQGQPSKVLWVPVKVEIKAGEPTSISGDIREVVHAEFIGEPRIWP